MISSICPASLKIEQTMSHGREKIKFHIQTNNSTKTTLKYILKEDPMDPSKTEKRNKQTRFE